MNIASPLGTENNYHPGSLVAQISEELNAPYTTWSRVSSLILKYYYLCVTGEDPQQEVPYRDLDAIYHDSQMLLIARRAMKIGNNPYLSLIDAFKMVRDYPRFWNHIQSIGYELRMIGDIAATSLIFRDIIERTIMGSQHKDRFVGLDLGTGTGILLLALHILAGKNNCAEVDIYGISDSTTCVAHTREVVRKIGFPGTVIEGDSTLVGSYDFLAKKQHISFTGNENIPSFSENIHGEPFFQNLQTIYDHLGEKIDWHTQFFPQRVTIKEGKVTHDCNARNHFQANEMQKKQGQRGGIRKFGDIEVSHRLLPLEAFHVRAARIVGIPACAPANVRW